MSINVFPTNILDTINLKMGLQDALGISSYVDHPSYWHEVFHVGLPLAGLILVLSLFIGLTIMAAIMCGISQPDGIQAKDDDELSSALASAASEEEFSNEITKAFESHGWGTDCTNSRDSIICGGTNLKTPVPAYNNDGREDAVNFAIDTEKLRSDNNIHLEDKKSRTFLPGEKIVLHVDVQKAK